MISSRVAAGFSLSTAVTALVTLGLVKPSITRAVVASSICGFAEEENSAGVSDPAPFDTLSFSSRISLCALLSPIPLMLFILFISSARIAFLISSLDIDESIMRAVPAPIPDTLIKSLKSSLSSRVANP